MKAEAKSKKLSIKIVNHFFLRVNNLDVRRDNYGNYKICTFIEKYRKNSEKNN